MLASRPRLSAAQNYELMKREAERDDLRKHVNSGMAVDGGGAGKDDDEDDPLGDGSNPFHAAIQKMAADLGEQKEHRNKSPAALYDHIARFNPAGKKLMTAATAWDLKRAAKVT